MGKITKIMQQKHRDTLSPWLKNWVKDAAAEPLPRLPAYLDTFPKPWELPRDDLYHWIPLLNRFDAVLDSFCSEYKLADSPQMRDFSRDVLLMSPPVDDQVWDSDTLDALGYAKDGDKEVLIAILNFSKTLLENCGNRSIYSSSSHLSNLLHTTDLHVLAATLEVSLELAKRYQASVRRINMPTRPPASLLNSHYNIELDRIQLLASPFVKTLIIQRPEDPSPATPTSHSARGKDKATGLVPRNLTPAYLNDISSLLRAGQDEDACKQWNGWGDIKLSYVPQTATPQEQEHLSSSSLPAKVTRGSATSAAPSTPTPLRRSATVGSSNSPRGARSVGSDASPSLSRTPRAEQSLDPTHKRLEIPQSMVSKMPTHELLERIPEDMPKSSRYEYLNRLRISKALLGSSESREQALAVRLLAITNLAYIYPEPLFIEKVLRQDNDEPRQNQLVYQLVELAHPSTTGLSVTPLWLQTTAVSLLEAISSFSSKYHDVTTALNANATHGVLLYLLRKAVTQMKEEESDPNCEKESWRKALFSLTQAITMARASPEAVTPGLLELLIEILNMRSDLAERTFQSILHFIDNVLSSFQGAFQYFCNVQGLDALTKLFIHEVEISSRLAISGKGTKLELRSSVMDYEIPYHQQHNLKWLLKFIHHALTNSYLFGGNNTERLLRNLADNSVLLHSVREIMENMSRFGSVVWTASITILSDFLNNDPSSAGAILESGLIKTYLMSITGDKSGDWPSAAAPQPRSGGGEEEHQEVAAGDEAEVEDQSHNDDGSESRDSSEDESIARPESSVGENILARVRALPPQENPASSIHPTVETITTIPTVLNSISLSRTGEKLVEESKSLSKYFEIFESPQHVRLLVLDSADCASAIGSSMDELARHHPRLSVTIANSALETVARIASLGINKAETAGWGARLLLKNPDGKVVTADERCLWQTSEKVVVPDGDLDVEMTDIGTTDEASTSKSSTSSAGSSDSGPEKGITPYILAISVFLTTYISNTSLRSLFVDKGGIELLLDLVESPSLPPQFMDSTAAHRLQTLISQLLDAYPTRGMPSLLSRTLKAVESLSPLTNKPEPYPYFTAFVIDVPDKEHLGNLSHGTSLARGLLKVQSMIKTLYQCFPYSSRHGTISLHQINVFDLYTKLVNNLGPLLRAVLSEEMTIPALVPSHWLDKKPSDTALSTRSATDTKAPDTDGKTLAELVTARSQTGSGEPQKMTEDEQSSHCFKNFQTVQILLHELMPTTFPFFQNLGKALFPRRGGNGEMHLYFKEKHWEVADSLACAVLDHLEVPGDDDQVQKKFHYWIIMLHTVSEMLVDPGRSLERVDRLLVIIPVLLSFKEYGGLDKLNAMLRIFMKEITKEQEDAQLKKLAFMGTRKILDLYLLILNGRHITDSLNHFGILSLRGHQERRQEHGMPSQLILEIRMTFWPVLMELWQSPILESGPIDILNKVTEILRTVASADEELGPSSAEPTSLTQLFKRSPQPFNWPPHAERVQTLIEDGFSEDLAREAIYRCPLDVSKNHDYCRIHARSLGGDRNPIPEVDAYTPPNSAASPVGEEPMAVDEGGASNAGNGDDISMEGQPDVPAIGNDQAAAEDQSQPPPSASTETTSPVSNTALPAFAVAPLQPEIEEPLAAVVTKEQMDEKRTELRTNNLIDRCLDVLQAHPASAHDISDLINAMMPTKDFASERQYAGEVFTNALMSFDIDDKEKGASIAAYAHLLSLLLSNDANSQPSFLNDVTQTLIDNMSRFLGFLKIPPTSSTEDLPPWLPYILLIFEILLREDESPSKVTWIPPTTENDPVEPPVFEVKERIVKDEDRTMLLEAVLDLLPRIGREETLSIAALRILVILTRNRSTATLVGDKKNLQRLFVMAKQLSSMGSDRLNSSRITAHIMTILRHIVEDDDTIKQVMSSQIKAAFGVPRQGQTLEIPAFLRSLYQYVLRSPELFVEVANETIKLDKWYPRSSTNRPNILLKSPAPSSDISKQEKTELPSNSVADGVKETTELTDKDMVDAQKSTTHETKRPVIENPDGVIHFLLCELFNYREVDDKDQTTIAKDAKPSPATTEPAIASTSSGAPASNPTPALPVDSPGETHPPETKDKKASKPTFKSDEHPIFIYRCFLLNCLSELLGSYNRTKVELINFKRSAPIITNTPVKPRSGVPNYLINDLLYNGISQTSSETTSSKKKYATRLQAQQVLVSLVSRTKERTLDRTRDRFDYDDEPELLFVQKFVLDTILKAYREASLSSENFETRFGRMLCLAELMGHMMGSEKETAGGRHADAITDKSHSQIKRLMYEKGYLTSLTHSIADIDLTLPGIKKTIKVILRVLHSLTQTGIQLSQSNIIPASASEEDEIASSSSMSELEDNREETPDLYRNSSLGMMELGGEPDFSGDSQDEDEEMYDDDEYGDEMEYGDDMSADDEENISDEDDALAAIEDIEAAIEDIEAGESGLIEVVMGDDGNNDEDDEMDEDGNVDGQSEGDDDGGLGDVSHHHLEIVDEDGNPLGDDGSSGWESDGDGNAEEEEDDAEIDYEAQVQHLNEQVHVQEHLHNMLHLESDEFGADMGGFNEGLVDEELEDDDDDEEEEDMDDDEDAYDEDYPYDIPPPNIPASLGWDTIVVEHGGVHHHSFSHPRRHVGRFIGTRDVDRQMFSRHLRASQVSPDEGVNPLLRRRPSPTSASSLRNPFPSPIYRSMIPPAFSTMDNPMAVLQGILDSLPAEALRATGPALLAMTHGARGEIRAVGGPNIRETRTETRRTEVYQEPQQAASFSIVSTGLRWAEEARLVFGGQGNLHLTNAERVSPLIVAKLTPDAMESERKLKEDAERRRKIEDEADKKRDEETQRVREALAAKQKAEQEKKDEEERKRVEREAADAAEAAEVAEQQQQQQQSVQEQQPVEISAPEDTPQPMEGVESTGDHAQPHPPTTENSAPAADQPRIVTTIRDRQIDITDLGIDLEYLEALPDEFREEVIAQAVTARRSEARENAGGTGEQSGEVFQEFLDALPADLRQEILHQERNEQRRRDGTGQQRSGANSAAPVAQEMDAASILLTFPPELRQEALMAQGHELIDQLPPEMAAQVRAMTGGQPDEPHRTPPVVGGRVRRHGFPSRPPALADEARKVTRRNVAQMLDPSGIATLLRLMFIAQNSNIRQSLFDVFQNVCQNHHNRLEVIRTVIQILQDGSVDMDAVERSFSHLSLRAKQKDLAGKTPQSIKRSFTTGLASQSLHNHSADVSPLLIVQQCLDLLVTLCMKNQRVPSIFLSEHDYSGSSLKRSLNKKGKGKEIPKAQKYAINFLLNLLDRDLVMDSAQVMQLLADLLDRITFPIATRERRRLQAEEDARMAAIAKIEAAATAKAEDVAKAAQKEEGQSETTIDETAPNQQEEDKTNTIGEVKKESVDISDSTPAAAAGASGASGASGGDLGEAAGIEAGSSSKQPTVTDSTDIAAKAKPSRLPVIPDHNLTLVVKIFVARECNAKTFQNTIATIKNLSYIPGAKAIFGDELIRQADVLSRSIVDDLEQLLPYIQTTESGTEIQGIALAKFSPNTSEQNKLLRVLTALDHLFDSKPSSKQPLPEDHADNQDLLGSLYRNNTFGIMWERLSACLSAMRQRENMVNVATILLPLIESLMVVCKNVATEEAKAENSMLEIVVTSPPPDSPISSLFFNFTEDHRRILNDLVRSSPKLMSGTFSLLVKNPKVLDFDNKRNWFNRSVHQRNQTRNTYPTLQLSVRRDHVFHDSFRSLYYKTGDEMKYGKLNIRFHGEEGVDAGGVTREWFQVLARQMFDPNYALFIPVSSDRTTFHPNKLSDINQEHLMFFKFIGRIIGKALYENRLLDCYFSRAVYKRILGKQVSVKDMESFDPDYYKSLCWILENNMTDIITETFSVEVDRFGVTTTEDLCGNGRDIPVTETNKQDYVRLVVEHKLLSSVKDQMQSFLAGFHEIIPSDLIAIFNEQELELLISGLPDVDIDDWKANTEYHNYPPTAPQIQWFWRAVRSFDKEERAKLLQFVTGTSKVPLNGFKDLEGMNGVSRFNIHRDYGNKNRLPSSHTCFNQLDLPEYESYDALRTQLIKAITTGSEYFGFA